LTRLPKRSGPALPSDPRWVRYSFAVTTCAVAIVVELFLDRATNQPVYPFLPALAAIIASAAFAGSGPGLTATGILVAWAAFDLWAHGRTPVSIFIRCLILLLEGMLLSFGSARMWNSKREAMQSEAWHRELLETAAEGIWVVDGGGIVTFANARMAGMLGVPVGELVGRNAEEFFFPADLSVERIRTQNLREGHKDQFDRRMRRAGGGEIWVLTCCNLVEAAEGSMPGSLAMMTDITERKRAEQALRRSEERFRNLFETVLEGVYQSTPEGRILAANPMLIEMLGLASEAELGEIDIARDLYVEPPLRARLMERLEHEGGFQNVEYELRRRDGRTITVLENARVVRDDNGTVLYYEGTLADITPRKRIEEQFRQAQKVEAMGRMAGAIAHDFNNVLTVITGYSQLVLSDLERGHAARASAEQVREAAEKAMALTKQLLQFSRRQSPIQGTTDLNRAIADARPAMQVMLNESTARKAELVLSLCAEPLPVHAGQTQIELTLLTLAACVRQAAPVEKLEVRTEPLRVDEAMISRWDPGSLVNSPAHALANTRDVQPGLFAALTVRPAPETGNAGENAAPLFGNTAFQTMDAAESAAAGLSSTHALITQRGGFLATDRADGAPAAFHAFLPCATQFGEEFLTAGAGVPGGETILLVEDEPLVRELSRDMLERQGYRVILASDAREAERIGALAGSFDLLITDAVMPNISGVELARRIRASHPGMKTLFISGYSDHAAERDQTGAEGAAFLQKPFSADSLGRKIRQVLSRI
jgi:two-component system, cell cycle sensor histidine kinase and response regulator CckA